MTLYDTVMTHLRHIYNRYRNALNETYGKVKKEYEVIVNSNKL